MRIGGLMGIGVMRRRYRPHFAFFVAALATLAAAAPVLAQSCRPRTKIVGGADARIQDWPWQAAIRRHADKPNVSEYFCGGTVISDRWVLTAAHCLHEFVVSATDFTTVGKLKDSANQTHDAKLEVVLGVADLRGAPAERVFAVDEVVMHETYRDALLAGEPEPAVAVGNDIALLRLTRSWPGPTVGLSLTQSLDPQADTPVRVAGYGTLAFGQSAAWHTRSDGLGTFSAATPVLQDVGILSVRTDFCKSQYNKLDFKNAVIGDGQLCAGLQEEAKDSCQGDSGGPLVTRDADNCPRQVGVVSWGARCAKPDAYGIYTRVSAYADWIQKHTGPLGQTVAAIAPAEKLTLAQLDEAVAQLEALLGSTKGRVDLKIRGGERVRLGSEVVFEAESRIDGRLLILDINAEREVTVIYPNQFVASGDLGRIRANQKVLVPGPDYRGFTGFRAIEPVGVGFLLAMVVPVDFDIEKIASPRAGLTKGFMAVNNPPSYLIQLIRQVELAVLGRNRAGGLATAQDAARWAYALTRYEIVR